MNEILEVLPFLIPLIIVQYGLIACALYHILTHKTYKHGNRVMWIILSVLVNFIGPILYFVFGKEDS